MSFNTWGAFNVWSGGALPSGDVSFDVASPSFAVAGGPLQVSPSGQISFEVDGPSFIIRGGPETTPQTIGNVTVSFAPNTITVTFKD